MKSTLFISKSSFLSYFVVGLLINEFSALLCPAVNGEKAKVVSSLPFHFLQSMHRLVCFCHHRFFGVDDTRTMFTKEIIINFFRMINLGNRVLLGKPTTSRSIFLNFYKQNSTTASEFEESERPVAPKQVKTK